MNSARFSLVVSRMEHTLARSVKTPDVAAIHHARTDSRRLDAALDALERETCETARMRKSSAKLRKLLKKVRHRAGAVRDLDVHLGLLQKLSAEGSAEASPGGGGAIDCEIAALDSELEQRRGKLAAKFQKKSDGWREKLERRGDAVLEAAGEAGDPPAGVHAAELALENFAELCRKMPVLDAGNLHEFRKGAKHARYIAEGGEDERSQRMAKRLKRVQDAIGDWHDWLELAGEAREALKGCRNELVKRIEERRERQFGAAMRTTERVREELQREWEGIAKDGVRRGEVVSDGALKKSA